MDKIVFNDRLVIKTLTDGVIKEFGSDFHSNYVDASIKAAKSVEWKTKGMGARFMRESAAEDYHAVSDIISYFNSIEFFGSPDKIIYSITVNDLSGIMTKDLTAEKDSEGHVIHSRENIFCGACPDTENDKFVTCIKTSYENAHLAVYDVKTDDYMTVTDGDSCDFDASFSRSDDSLVYFASKGVGRNADGEFVKFSHSSIYSYDVFTGDIEEILSDPNKSLIRPKDDGKGNLFYITRPEQKNKTGFFRLLLDIILIPWKLLKAMYYFAEMFTMMFTGKGFTEKSANPAKTMKKSQGMIVIDDNLINAEEEYRKNLRHKDNPAGVAPWSWQLVRRTESGETTSLANGVIDYCLLSDGSIAYTNGKHVIVIGTDGKRNKIADTDLCTKISCFI